MKELIRAATFETNSSSAHALAIASSDVKVYDTIYPNDKGIISIEYFVDDFYRKIKTNDASTKASYMFQAANDYDSCSGTNTYERIQRIILEHTGADGIEFIPNSKNEEYVDHGYMYTTSMFRKILQNDDEYIKNVIFNKNVYFIFYNDNLSLTPDDYFDNPVYNESGVSTMPEKEYALVIKDYPLSYKIPHTELSDDDVKNILRYIFESKDEDNELIFVKEYGKMRMYDMCPSNSRRDTKFENDLYKKVTKKGYVFKSYTKNAINMKERQIRLYRYTYHKELVAMYEKITKKYKDYQVASEKYGEFLEEYVNNPANYMTFTYDIVKLK